MPPLAARADDLDIDVALRALADPNRRAILTVIRSGPRAVGEIADELGLSQQTTSHHLRVLRDARIARSSRSGTRHLFALETTGLRTIHDYLEEFWPAKREASSPSTSPGTPRAGRISSSNARRGSS